MDFVVGPPVAEIDPADERDVGCRAVRSVDKDDVNHPCQFYTPGAHRSGSISH